LNSLFKIERSNILRQIRKQGKGEGMYKKVLRGLLFLCLLLCLSNFIMAQRQTGSIFGKVTDEKGAVLPGASVTIKGPAMMGTLAYTTSREGDFRFADVPPGTNYVLTVELSGFATVVQKGIIVDVGKTATINVQLVPATISNEVTVIAKNPTVDITSSKVSINYTADIIKNLPYSRDFYDVIQSAPGVVSEGDPSRRTFSSVGGTVRTNQVSLDGISITSPTEGTNEVGVPYDIFDEFEFEFTSHPAEVGSINGLYVNIVTKSGGNDFHGELTGYYFNRHMTSSVIPPSEAQAVGLEAPRGFINWNDYSFNLGGPILRDKLWFFTNLDYVGYTGQAESIVNGVFNTPHKEIQTFTKLTGQPHPNLRITGTFSFKDWKEPFYEFGGYYYDNSRAPNVSGATNYLGQVIANWIVDMNTLLNLRSNYIHNYDPWRTQPGVDPTSLSTEDLVTGIKGGPLVYSRNLIENAYNFILSGTRFLNNFLGGSHEIKAGVGYELANYDFDPWKVNPIYEFLADGSPYCLGPGVGMFFAFPYGNEVGDTPQKVAVRTFSAYVQDDFKIANRLTLNLGIRYDEPHGDIPSVPLNPSDNPVLVALAPEVFTPMTLPSYNNAVVWRTFSPRLGLVFDLFGDGKTAIKASWSRYTEPLLGTNLFGTGINQPGWLMAGWIDTNMDGQIDPTDSFIPMSVPPNPLTLNPADVLDPHLKAPYTDEFVVGIERELLSNFSIGITYINKKDNRIIEDLESFRGLSADSGWWVPYTVTDPGPDGVFGTSDDGSITVYAVKNGAPESLLKLQNCPEAVRRYHAVELIFNKRMSKGWQLLGSLTFSKFKGNVGASYNESAGYGPDNAFASPNWLVNRYGDLELDRPFQLRLQGSVQLPIDFMLSAYYLYMSGAPYGRTLRVYFPDNPDYDPSNPPYADVYAQAPGTSRLQAINNLDIRISKNFRIGRQAKFDIFVDVLNVLGQSWIDYNQDLGGWINADGSFTKWPTYGMATAINGMRTLKVSGRFTF
jgi:hypothetical protein